MPATSPLSELKNSEWESLTINQIAARFHMKASTVHAWRRLHRKPKGPRSPGSGRPPKFDLSLIDWRLSSIKNAERLGCTRQYIDQLKSRRKTSDFA